MHTRNSIFVQGNGRFYSKLMAVGLLVFLFYGASLKPVLADEPPPAPMRPGEAENIENPILPPENNLKTKPALANEFSGAFSYDYPLEIAPGRNNLQPDLRLLYNSQSRDIGSFFGQGWSLNIPYIEHINKKGIEKLYTEPTYYSSLSDELVDLGSGVFGSKVDNGEFISYTYEDLTWTAVDKSGTHYTFGLTQDSRQYEDENPEEIYKWMIEEIRDTNNNFIRFEYEKDEYQIYPSKIFYTGQDDTDGIFEIEFIRETRPDETTSGKTGFPVTTKYRIKEIQAKISGNWVKKYVINYTSGENETTSLLSSITKHGKDEAAVVTSLSPTTFEYQLSGNDHWETETTWNAPAWISEGNGGMVGDINGDGFDDLLRSFYSGSGSGTWFKGAYINNGNGQFVENTNYDPPFHFAAAAGSQFWDYGARLIDVNGDGLADLISDSRSSSPKAYLNTGSGWEANSDWYPPLDLVYWHGDISAYIANLNGDNLPDVIGTRYEWNGTGYPLVTYAYINDGEGWTRDLSWTAPLDVHFTSGTLFTDINGDGLDDIVQSRDGTQAAKKTFINNGQGQWVESTTYIPQQYFFSVDYYGSVTDKGYRIFDVNGDGLADIVKQGYGAFINNGTSWEIDNDLSWNQDLELGGAWHGSTTPYTAYISNMSGDGMPDIYTAKWDNGTNTPYSILIRNNESRVNILKKLTYETGGSTSITYASTPSYKNGSTLLNPTLPIIIDTVSSLSHNDGLGNITTENYVYEGGSYYYNGPFDTKLGGFSKVTKTDSLAKTINYYHQGNSSNSGQGEYNDHVSKIGKKYREEVRGLNGSLFKTTITTWDKSDLGNGRTFVKQTQALEMTYDGDTSHKDKAATYAYSDTTGNLTTETNWGQVTGSDNGTFSDTGSDKYTTTRTYVSNTSAHIIGLLSKESTTNQTGNLVKETKLYYDTQSWGNVTKGNQTKQEEWRNVGDPYVTNQKTYNSYGLVTSETDPRNKVTDYTYDTHNLYRATSTNPLNQVTSFTYDYSSGAVKQTTDPNNNIFTTIYDGLDRPLEEKIPNVSGSGQVTKTLYEYTDTANAIRTKVSTYLDGSNIVDSYTYFDGLNRKLQVRREAATSTQFSVRDFVYSNGLLLKESLPYFSNGSARTTATTDTDLYTTYSYDALKRLKTAVTTVGTTTTNYSDWKTIITDPENKVKDIYRDAYNNVIQVDEHNNSSTYTTTYEYNLLRKLTKLTDALSNIRNFTYDGIGNVLVAQDLHASSDTTFGSWSYSYDVSGNLTSRTDANNQTVNFTYDDINRILTENYTGHSGTEVSYEYDACTQGEGKLCEVTNGASITEYDYNKLGQRSSEKRTIGTEEYITSYTYDRQGNQLIITNPDNSSIKYLYDAGGSVNKIQHKESNTGTYSDVISSITYNPVGLREVVNYGNGSTTTNTYDADELYRLRTKVTDANSINVQDITYTYDSVGNITQILDGSETDTAKTTDYSYDDLHRLIVADIQEATTVELEAQDEQAEEDAPPGFVYDAIGNMLNNPDRGDYHYDGDEGSNYANPHAVTTTDDGYEYVYDHNGNVLDDETNEYIWDYNNRLIQVNTDTESFYHSYDSSGQRIKTVTPDDTLYSPTKFYTEKNNTVEKHIFLGDTAIATVEGSNANADVFTIHADHLTGSNVVTDDSEEISVLSDYYAFGKIRIDEQTGSYDERRKFTGHEYDKETGLTYMEARYYDPNLGRFLSVDPVFQEIGTPESVQRKTQLSYENYLGTPQVLNAYSYVANNPLKYKDQTGEFIFLAVPAAIYGAALLPAAITTVAAVGGGIASWYLGESIGYTLEGNHESASQSLNNVEGALAATGIATGGLVAAESLVSQAAKQGTPSVKTEVVKRGTQNPATKESTAIGRMAHQQRTYEEGVIKEVRLPSGRRMDGYNASTKTVYELKPDNARAVSRGQKQVQQYCLECNTVYGGQHKGYVVTYKPQSIKPK